MKRKHISRTFTCYRHIPRVHQKVNIIMYKVNTYNAEIVSEIWLNQIDAQNVVNDIVFWCIF